MKITLPVPRAAALAVAMLASLVALPGCGESGPTMGRVHGKVTYNGQPVPKGTITFVPTAPGGRNATGAIAEDGTYALQTEAPGDGAIVGDYKVTVAARDDVILDYIPKKAPPPKRLTPEKYENPETSGLTAKVERGSNTRDFALTD
ncbi:hypothetical protein [Paludisphaera sp.]|uniref:hypothetical protein n=1 Tax=Paludisphaera sp. TaxID=2017432 RepID=UPI00301D8F4B